MRAAFAFLFLVLTAGLAPAQDKLAPSLKPFVDSKTLAGAVMLVADKEKILAHEAVGYADVENNTLMGTTHLFWIASMSKPITAAALMLLIDEGKLSVDDPVEKFLPEFKGQMVLEKKDGKSELKKASRPITVKDILSHTSGLIGKNAKEAQVLDSQPLREAVADYAKAPLQFEPGTQYQYNNPGINTAGRIIEVVSGMSYEEFLQKRLFTPLGMKDTTFWPQGEQLKRLAKTYKAAPDRKGLEASPILLFGQPLDNKTKRHAFPGGGLFSTSSDLAKFCQMILNGGELDGKRYLSEKAVKQMTTTQTGDLKGGSYGLGWMTNKAKYETFGHGGAYNTLMWIDPQKQLVAILLMQHVSFPTDEGKSIRPTFQKVALDTFGK